MKINAFPRRFAMLIAIFLVFAAFGNHVQTAQADNNLAPGAKTTWLWHTQLIKTSPAEILDFSESQHIGIIYLQISSKVDLDSYRTFIRQARSKQIEVHALNGAPDWALSTSRPKLDSFMKWIVDYQKTAAPEEMLAGIHVDIEPYLLPEWKTDWSGLVTQWQENIDALVQQAEAANLPISAALPFWLNNYKVPGSDQTLSSWMISRFESVTLMSYRDQAKAIYDTAKNELLEGERLNKKVYTGVETKPSSEGNFITFYEEGNAVLNEQLLQLEQLASAHASFEGIAVHDLVGWMDLVKRDEPPAK
ncbi:hypothetical protein DFP94_11060 [Fontibacillus phaseoli]|uniref:Amidase n=1 Tax=Fontibacillus phaseoli TaxID=1416533 RepID=A0A369B652_9BACL|nr:hypothetical protein [Fontibacillus phaseoli]RCX16999.1 hypothetical protein DFP94_11060 [Fontibacillus phaseoli]